MKRMPTDFDPSLCYNGAMDEKDQKVAAVEAAMAAAEAVRAEYKGRRDAPGRKEALQAAFDAIHASFTWARGEMNTGPWLFRKQQHLELRALTKRVHAEKRRLRVMRDCRTGSHKNQARKRRQVLPQIRAHKGHVQYEKGRLQVIADEINATRKVRNYIRYNRAAWWRREKDVKIPARECLAELREIRHGMVIRRNHIMRQIPNKSGLWILFDNSDVGVITILSQLKVLEKRCVRMAV